MAAANTAASHKFGDWETFADNWPIEGGSDLRKMLGGAVPVPVRAGARVFPASGHRNIKISIAGRPPPRPAPPRQPRSHAASLVNAHALALADH